MRLRGSVRPPGWAKSSPPVELNTTSVLANYATEAVHHSTSFAEHWPKDTLSQAIGLLMTEISGFESHSDVKNWVKELKKMLGSDICLVIAGNKIDLEKHRTVSVQNAEEYAESVGAKHYHTSAKLDRGIEEMFLELSQRMIEQAQESDLQKASSLGRTSSMRRNVVVVDDEEESNIQTKSGCCGGGGTS
uniref:Uncharacterized protein n=1 Tax=Timema shepardi TaxID=629360 RepID=A0A7R9FZ76_TIMSH|nr:unnamed protein product [Timema shepardi]